MFYLICVWINAWLTSREAGDLRRHRAHYDVIVMKDFSNMAFEWMAAVLPANEMPSLKIFVN